MTPLDEFDTLVARYFAPEPGIRTEPDRKFAVDLAAMRQGVASGHSETIAEVRRLVRNVVKLRALRRAAATGRLDELLWLGGHDDGQFFSFTLD